MLFSQPDYLWGKKTAQQSNVASGRIQTSPFQVLLKDRDFHCKISPSVFRKDKYNKVPDVIGDDEDTDMKSDCSNLLNALLHKLSAAYR